MSDEKHIHEATVFSRGRITIPKAVRDVLGLSAGDQITFIEDGLSFIIEKVDKTVEGNTDADIDSAISSSEEELRSGKSLIEAREALKELRQNHFPTYEISSDTLQVMNHSVQSLKEGIVSESIDLQNI